MQEYQVVSFPSLAVIATRETTQLVVELSFVIPATTYFGIRTVDYQMFTHKNAFFQI